MSSFFFQMIYPLSQSVKQLKLEATQACTVSNPMQTALERDLHFRHATVLNAITAELVAWQADDKEASDALVRIAEVLHDTGRLEGRLPDFCTRRSAS